MPHHHLTQETWSCLSPSPLKLPSFCAFKWLKFLIHSQNAWLSDTRCPWGPPPNLPTAEPAHFSSSHPCPDWGRGHVLLPLVNLTSLPLTSVLGPQGYSEVGKKMELRRVEGVSGAWGSSRLIHILFPLPLISPS